MLSTVPSRIDTRLKFVTSNIKSRLEERIKRYDGGYRKRGFQRYDAVCLLDYKL